MPSRKAAKDSNRYVVVVTGANGGLGFGICQRLLRELSNASFHSPASSSSSHPQPLPALTLILACRSRSKAEQAARQLLHEHELGLAGRRVRGGKEADGWNWRDRLEVVTEEVDMDRVGGENGLLGFSQRIKENYPHLSFLILNAGFGAFTGISWTGAARQFFTDPRGCVTEPNYLIQEKGRLSADGERGGVWGVNVLSGYILIKELESHLRRHPSHLPFPSRAIYISSSRASPDFLPQPNPAADPQLLTAAESYDASKYVGDLVMSEVDWQLSHSNDQPHRDSDNTLRCAILDPGVVWTGMFGPFLPFVLEMCMAAVFYIMRLLGSRIHTISPYIAAGGINTLIRTPEKDLPRPIPPPMSSQLDRNPGDARLTKSRDSNTQIKFQSNASRFGKECMGAYPVKEYSTYAHYRVPFAEECEKVRQDWLARYKQAGNEDRKKVEGQGVSTS